MSHCMDGKNKGPSSSRRPKSIPTLGAVKRHMDGDENLTKARCTSEMDC